MMDNVSLLFEGLDHELEKFVDIFTQKCMKINDFELKIVENRSIMSISSNFMSKSTIFKHTLN